MHRRAKEKRAQATFPFDIMIRRAVRAAICRGPPPRFLIVLIFLIVAYSRIEALYMMEYSIHTQAASTLYSNLYNTHKSS
jgi:hypothetical protein